MKIMQLLVAGLTVAACSKSAPKQETFPGRQLGESTASPGSNPSKPAPLTPDDPRVMNVSATITPQQQQNAVKAPVPPAAPRTDATSSTPVAPPAGIAPPTSAPAEQRTGVNTPPPPPNQ